MERCQTWSTIQEVSGRMTIPRRTSRSSCFSAGHRAYVADMGLSLDRGIDEQDCEAVIGENDFTV